jgi:hypothetical protein
MQSIVGFVCSQASLEGSASDSVQKLCTLYFNVERAARAEVVPHLLTSIIHYMCESRQRVRDRERERVQQQQQLFSFETLQLVFPSSSRIYPNISSEICMN